MNKRLALITAARIGAVRCTCWIRIAVREVAAIVSCVSAVRGVKDVINNLMIHESSSGISSLQGHPIGSENR